MHRLRDGDHLVASYAPVVSGEQHRPFGQGHKDGIEHPEFHRNLDRAIARIKSDSVDVGLEVPQHRRVLFRLESRRLEIRRQSNLENVLRFVRRPKRLGIGTGQRDESWLEPLPDIGIHVAPPQWPSRKPRNTVEVWERRHVHDRQRRHACRCDASHQLPHTFRAVLRFLHGKHDQVERAGVDGVRHVGGELPVEPL